MSITYGFYNSVNGDRKYDARDFSSIFNGVINDGVFMSIGSAFAVKADTGMNINVGIGRAWFNGTWTYNDAILPLTIEAADTIQNRIDAVIIEINVNDNVRENFIKVIKGTPSEEPVPPELIKSNNDKFQYPLAYITVNKNITSITQANITNKIGTSDCPYVTGLLQTMNIDNLISQWETEWDEWVLRVQNDNAQWTNEQREEFLNWADTFKSVETSKWNEWFANIQGQLSSDAAGNLQLQINNIIETEFNRYYSMINKTININKDSNGNTTSIVETSDEASATTTFSEAEGVKNIITSLIPNSGLYNYTKTVTISSNSNGTVINETYTKTPK